MFEQDYIMRQIKEMIRAVLKLLFNIDTESAMTQWAEKSEAHASIGPLLKLVDEGKINEAENALYDITEDCREGSLKTALLFYAHLNEKSDSFLEAHNFSRDEVKQGLKDILSRFGLGSISDLFL